jgi:hypothetical protein
VTRGVPLAWLAPGTRELPADLAPAVDLAASRPNGPRLLALAPAPDAPGAAARLRDLPGVERAGWLESDRVLTAGSPARVVAWRTARAWRQADGTPVAPGEAAVLSTARLRLAQGRRQGA